MFLLKNIIKFIHNITKQKIAQEDIIDDDMSGDISLGEFTVDEFTNELKYRYTRSGNKLLLGFLISGELKDVVINSIIADDGNSNAVEYMINLLVPKKQNTDNNIIIRPSQMYIERHDK